jgi:putative nucleotidyltransferase with HDIG domain
MAMDLGGRRSAVMTAVTNPTETSGVRGTAAGMSISGRVTATVAAGQTVAARIDHLAEAIVGDQNALRRTLPDVAAEVLEMCGRSGGDAGAMERTLTRDPFMSAQVVSIANSAMFSPRMPILSVRDAVVRIGLDAVRDVVLMVVTNSTMFRVRGLEAQVEVLRRRMLASASAARLLARALRAESEYGFLAGLLHDIGELVLIERCAQDGLVTAALWDDPQDGAVVRERIYAHHTSVGAALCASWRLPSGVVDAARFHHDYKSGGKTHLAAHLVAAADHLAAYILPGTTPPSAAPHEAAVIRELGLNADQIRALLDQAKPAAAGLIASR